MNAIAAPVADVRRIDLSQLQANAIGGTGLWVCLAQLKARSTDDIANDRPSPENVRVLNELFSVPVGAASCRLTADSQPDQTCVVVCPEYAFGSDDWARLDALVANFPRSIILVAPMGASPIAAIDRIKQSAAQSGTSVSEGWTTPLAGQRPVNFGAIWVKSGNTRECVLFGKTFSEQRLEEPFLEIVAFRESTEILLSDLRIFPAICADLVRQNEAGGPRTVTQRIIDSAQKQPLLPTLCTASLMQLKGQASQSWQQAIDRLVGGLTGARAVVLVCNVATEKPDNRKDGDKWRNLSGIYVPKQHAQQGQRHDQIGSAYFDLVNVMAWPLRTWRAHAMFGSVRLPPYSANGGLHPWSGFARYEIEATLPEYRGSPSADDVCLLCHVSAIGPDENYSLQSDVLAHVASEAYPTALDLVAQFLDGPFAKAVSKISVPKHPNNVRECLAGANALLQTSRRHGAPLTWQSQSARRGQINLNVGSLALWSSGTLSPEAMLDLLRRELVERPLSERLVIFGKGKDGDLHAADWEGMCADPINPQDNASEYPDLPVTEAAPLANGLVVHSFKYISRLIEAAWKAANQDGFPELEKVMAVCEGK